MSFVRRRDEFSGEKIRTTAIADEHYQHVILSDAAGNTLVPSGSVVTTPTETFTTVNNTASTVLAANASRIGGYIQNLSTTETLFYSFAGTATTGKFKIGPYQTLPLKIDGNVYRGAVSMIADDAGPYNIGIVECT